MTPALLLARRAVVEHPLLRRPLSPSEARVFMEHHVFAVWDFMTLLKRLQRDLTCTTLPWRPPANPRFARLVNEIVLGEESDEDGEGGHTSHFELYLGAMRDVGADPGPIDRFLRDPSGDPVRALRRAGAPAAAATFVLHTLALALDPETPTAAIAAAFFHAREAVIPDMFRQLLVAVESAGRSARRLRHYLSRHIEVDGESHGPLAEALLAELGDGVNAALVESAALGALAARRALWDGVLAAIDAPVSVGAPETL